MREVFTALGAIAVLYALIWVGIGAAAIQASESYPCPPGVLTEKAVTAQWWEWRGMWYVQIQETRECHA